MKAPVRPTRRAQSPARHASPPPTAPKHDRYLIGELFWTRAISFVSSGWFWLVLIVLLTLALYGPILNDWFSSDDFFFLRAARYVGPQDFFKEAFDFSGYDKYEHYIDFLRDEEVALPFLAYRPLTFVSLGGMNLVFGENAAGYHAVSIAVHLANTFLVWLIASRLFRAKLPPRLAALIFALHPAYVAGTAWISGIGTSLATLAALVGLFFLMKSLDRNPPRWGWYLGSVAAYGASLFFHQETISWVVAYAAFYLFVAHSDRGLEWKLKRWPILLPFVGVALGAYALQSWIVAHTPIHEGSFRVGPHMLTHFKDFSSTALFPDPSGTPSAQFLAFILILFIMASLPALAYLRGPRATLLGIPIFAVVWFLVSLAPELTGDVSYFFTFGVLDRKLYAAGPALAIMLVLFGTALLDLMPRRLQPYLNALATVSVVLALIGGITLGDDHREEISSRAVEANNFVEQLRATYPSLPPGSTLYVVGAPEELRAFGDVHLLAAIQAFYGRVDARSVKEKRAAAIEASPDPGEYVFRYQPKYE